jgi:hypothetical protein
MVREAQPRAGRDNESDAEVSDAAKGRARGKGKTTKEATLEQRDTTEEATGDGSGGSEGGDGEEEEYEIEAILKHQLNRVTEVCCRSWG